jgi:glycosyltransferase involved in cell wall biosynthesis
VRATPNLTALGQAEGEEGEEMSGSTREVHGVGESRRAREDVESSPGGADLNISAILPSFNRSAALQENLSALLAIEGLGELIVVDDCSGDDTEAYLKSVEDPLLRVIRHSQNRGSPAARTTGIAAARFGWVLMLEDDCRVPTDYGQILLEVATATQASIVGAPWVHASAEELESEVRERRANAVTRFGLDTPPGMFPIDDIETPFLPALILAKREIFRTLSYDSGYRGNAWREETSLFLAAAEAGHRCVLTHRTFSYQTREWTGGQHGRRLPYEASVIRNNWRFLRRHEAFLRTEGYMSSAWRGQMRFVVRRFASLVRGKASALVGSTT